MKWAGMYLVGFIFLVGGILAALWKLGLLASISATWIVIGVVIVMGFGIMISVSNSGSKENVAIDRQSEAPALTGARRLLLSGQRCDLPELFQSQTDRTLCARVLARDFAHGEAHVEFRREGAVFALGPGLAEVGGEALASLLAFDFALHQVHGGVQGAQGARLRVGALFGVCLAGDGIHAVGEGADDGQCGIELHGAPFWLVGLSIVGGGLPPPCTFENAAGDTRLTGTGALRSSPHH